MTPDEAQTVGEILRGRFRFIEKFGFVDIAVEQRRDEVELLFVSEDSRRKVRIVATYQDTIPVVIVSISNFSGGNFLLEHWLKHKGKAYDGQAFEMKNLTGQIEYRASVLQAEAESDMKNILLGRDWENVPFDWGDYR